MRLEAGWGPRALCASQAGPGNPIMLTGHMAALKLQALSCQRPTARALENGAHPGPALGILWAHRVKMLEAGAPEPSVEPVTPRGLLFLSGDIPDLVRSPEPCLWHRPGELGCRSSSPISPQHSKLPGPRSPGPL